MSVSVKIQKLLKLIVHHDKDERFMATSDLSNLLEHMDGNLDQAIQLQVSKSILSQLEDASPDVQTVAVKCLSSLMKKISVDQLFDVVDKLCSLCIDPSKQDSRDIYAIGMKNFLTDLPLEHSAVDGVCARIATALLEALRNTDKLKDNSVSFAVECVSLEVCKELTQKFGGRIAVEHLENLLTLLSSSRYLANKNDGIRKRALSVIGVLVLYVSDGSFSAFMESLLAAMESGEQRQDAFALYAFLQTVSVISQSAGTRVGRYLGKIIPLLQHFCGLHAESAFRTSSLSAATHSAHDALLELWENTLSAFESIILRCPKEVSQYIPALINIAISFIAYDPNYTYADSDKRPAGMEMAAENESDGAATATAGSWDDDAADGDNEWDEGEDERMEEDEEDDNTWKVRRAAVRVLSAFIRAKGQDTLSAVFQSPNSSYFDTLLSVLMDRFKERDINVKHSVFSCCADLIRESVIRTSDSDNDYFAEAAFKASSPPTGALRSSASQLLASLQIPVLVRCRSYYSSFTEKLSLLIDRSLQQLNAASKVETKRAIFALWKDIASVHFGGLEKYLPLLLPPLFVTINTETDTRLKGDALTVLRLIVEAHQPQSLTAYFQALVEAANVAARQSYLKLKADALKFIASITEQLHKVRHQSFTASATLPLPLSDMIHSLYDSVYAQLILKDVDQEVKEASLQALASLLAFFGDLLKETLPACLPVVIQRLQNELTRRSALKALTTIANSPLKLNLSAIISSNLALPTLTSSSSSSYSSSYSNSASASASSSTSLAVVDELCGYLRKDKATLRQDAVSALTAFCRCRVDSRPLFSDLVLSQLLRESSALLALEIDNHLAFLIFQLLTEILKVHTLTAADEEVILHKLYGFMKSPLLHGKALEALVALFEQLITNSAPPSSSTSSSSSSSVVAYFSVLENLIQLTDASASFSSSLAVAQVIAAITAAAPLSDVNRQQAIRQFLECIQPAAKSDRKHLFLLALGEIGRSVDLSEYGAVTQQIYAAFSSDSEAIRNAAAYGLGNVCLANLKVWLPQLIQLIESSADGRNRYLLLSALREVISRQTHKQRQQNNKHLEDSESCGRGDDMNVAASATGTPAIHLEEKQSELLPYVDSIIPLLFSSSTMASHDESVRSMLSETIGALAAVQSAALFGIMAQHLQSTNAHTRAIVVSAFRHSLTSHYFAADELTLRQYIPQFLRALNDSDLNVCRWTLLTLGALAHSHFDLLLEAVKQSNTSNSNYANTPISTATSSTSASSSSTSSSSVSSSFSSSSSPFVPSHPLLRLVSPFLEPKDSLVRVINMGPFTHKIDDGLPIRKAAFQVLDTFLDSAPHRLDLSELTRLVRVAFSDHEDLQLMAYQMYYKLAVHHGSALLSSLEEFPGLIRKHLTEKLKEAKGEDESLAERAKDVLRAAVRCMAALSRIPGLEHYNFPQWTEFYQRVLKTQLLAKLLAEMQM